MAAQRRRQRKKLIEAARWWAGARDEAPGTFEPDYSVLEAMEAWGASAEDLDKVRARIDAAANAPPAEGEAFGVYAENLPVVAAFEALRTQWQYAGMAGQRMGFCYAGVTAWLELFVHRRQRRTVMHGLQVMERAVLVADQEQRDKKERE